MRQRMPLAIALRSSGAVARTRPFDSAYAAESIRRLSAGDAKESAAAVWLARSRKSRREKSEDIDWGVGGEAQSNGGVCVYRGSSGSPRELRLNLSAAAVNCLATEPLSKMISGVL